MGMVNNDNKTYLTTHDGRRTRRVKGKEKQNKKKEKSHNDKDRERQDKISQILYTKKKAQKNLRQCQLEDFG